MALNKLSMKQGHLLRKTDTDVFGSATGYLIGAWLGPEG